MRISAFLTACFALLATLPLAAGAAAAPPPCAAVTEPALTDATGVYLVSEVTSAYAAYEVWREANDVPGFQSRACVDADGRLAGTDERVGRADTRSLPGVPSVPRCLLNVCII